MQLQSWLSDIVVYANGNIDMELLESVVRTLDYLRWVNFTYKVEKHQINQKEFMNEEVGNAIDLTPHARQWSGLQLPAARNNQAAKYPSNPEYFNLIDYTWLFPTVAKLTILSKHFANVTAINQTYWNLREVWPALAQGRPVRDKFVLEVDRARIVDDVIARLHQFNAN